MSVTQNTEGSTQGILKRIRRLFLTWLFLSLLFFGIPFFMGATAFWDWHWLNTDSQQIAGVVTRDRYKKNLIDYSYTVGEREFTGTGRKQKTNTSVGDAVTVHYSASHPGISNLGLTPDAIPATILWSLLGPFTIFLIMLNTKIIDRRNRLK